MVGGTSLRGPVLAAFLDAARAGDQHEPVVAGGERAVLAGADRFHLSRHDAMAGDVLDVARRL